MNIDLLKAPSEPINTDLDLLAVLYGIGLSYGVTSKINSYDFCNTNNFKSEKAKLFEISKKLAFKEGGENKFLRMLHVKFDIQAPFYWWKQWDTYKIGTTAQSESTMHTILHKPFEVDQFDIDQDTIQKQVIAEQEEEFYNQLLATIKVLNNLREVYFKHENKYVKEDLWRHIIQLLPDSYLQRRIVDVNYATLQNMYLRRHNHKLQEWRDFCDFIAEYLPYSEYYIVPNSGM